MYTTLLTITLVKLYKHCTPLVVFHSDVIKGEAYLVLRLKLTWHFLLGGGGETKETFPMKLLHFPRKTGKVEESLLKCFPLVQTHIFWSENSLKKSRKPLPRKKTWGFLMEISQTNKIPKSTLLGEGYLLHPSPPAPTFTSSRSFMAALKFPNRLKRQMVFIINRASLWLQKKKRLNILINLRNYRQFTAFFELK